MSVHAIVALAAVIFVLLLAGLDAFDRWRARRRIRQIHAEVLEIAEQAGIPPEELK